ncbi:hypothetical protein B0H14DRAFT_3907496 [Mycena olivaceomarginata]|nr:hypothetical protein B0H14DRAFT_3907496 [Mycena olivaceomarginata]
MRPDSYPLPPSSRPALAHTFPAAMDDRQFSQPYRDGSSEVQRRIRLQQPAYCHRSFGFPTDSGFSSVAATPSINLTDFGHPTRFYSPPSASASSTPVHGLGCGHELVKRYPEEFAERYKKDHRHHIEYLAQAEVNS